MLCAPKNKKSNNQMTRSQEVVRSEIEIKEVKVQVLSSYPIFLCGISWKKTPIINQVVINTCNIYILSFQKRRLCIDR